MKINTKYSINDKVYINGLKLWGKVKSIFFDGEIQYNVRYFYESKLQTCYFLEDEISLEEENKEAGFKA